MVKVNHENENDGAGSVALEMDRDFEALQLCDTILEKVFQLTRDLVPALREDDGTTPGAREGSLVIMKLQAIDGHLEKLVKRVDL